ncbi:Translation initiation factor eIF-2B subunit epsilon [Trichinella britovi]|uniref:Translation initiation factor eIF2B subunit epsilon n=1 Tax=Trichinella britovi TaxID=45882 RepID=A0A0V1CE49_TRIBR|nr:Translation initiation factor eIF-2B subunit epsilon [Trichinella britovi]
MEKKEPPLSAVLLAEPFNPVLSFFEKPSYLIPLVNVPLIDYALEFLKTLNLSHLFVVTCDGNTTVKEHVQRRLIGHEFLDNLTFVKCDGCYSVADVFRDIDQRALIKNDFLFLQSGFLCNSNLQSVIDEHRARRKKNKSCIMTILCRTCPKEHPCRSRCDDLVVELEESTQRLLNFRRLEGDESSLTLASNASMTFDLLDCRACICTAQVPPLFSDNFDFQTLDDLMREVLINEEILGHTVHVATVDDCYAASVHDYHSYLSISQNIMERWSYPLTPDLFYFNVEHSIIPKPCYRWKQRNIYSHLQEAQVEKNVKLGKNVTIGSGCIIRAGTEIVNSVIGNNCVIESNCRISNCIIWENVFIGECCVVKETILANKSVLMDHCNVGPRVVIGSKVTVAHGTTLADGRVICGKKLDDDIESVPASQCKYDDSSPALELRAGNPGEESRKSFWPAWFPLVVVKAAPLALVNELDETDADFSMDLEKNMVDRDYRLFCTEVQESLMQGAEEKVPSENMILEINSSKHAYNVTMEQVYQAVVNGLFQLPLEQANCQLSAVDYWKALMPVMRYLEPVLKNYFKNIQSQQILLDVLLNLAVQNECIQSALVRIVHSLFEMDILEEDQILNWYESMHKNSLGVVKLKLEPLVEWLRQAEEESSGEMLLLQLLKRNRNSVHCIFFCSAAMAVSNSKATISDWVANILNMGSAALMERTICEQKELIKPEPQGSKHFSLLENQPKNRYRDIPCLDHSRVILRGSTSDYIHANWVTVPEMGIRVILTQGPKENTLSDFWDMVAQEDAMLLTNLVKTEEISTDKCVKYYPELHKSTKCEGADNYIVICTRVSKKQFFTKMKLVLYCKKTEERRNLVLFTYNEWPDHGVPACGQFVQFVRYIIKCMKKMNNEQHMLIHCSAGVGRSGTLLASIRLLLQLEAGERPNVFQVVNSIRQERARAVQGLNQYRLLYCVILYSCILFNHVPSDKVADVKNIIRSLLQKKQKAHNAHKRKSELRIENNAPLELSCTAMENADVLSTSKVDESAAHSSIAIEKEAEAVVRSHSSLALTACQDFGDSSTLENEVKRTGSKGFLDRQKEIFAKHTVSPKQVKSADKKKQSDKVNSASKPQKSNRSRKSKKSSNKQRCLGLLMLNVICTRCRFHLYRCFSKVYYIDRQPNSLTELGYFNASVGRLLEKSLGLNITHSFDCDLKALEKKLSKISDLNTFRTLVPELIQCGNQFPSEAWSLFGDRVVGYIETSIDQVDSDEELSRWLLLIAYYLPPSDQRWLTCCSRLSENIERISDDAFLCLVHAFMLRRSIPNSVFPILDMQIRRRLGNFSFDDLGLISLAYFKCCRRFQHGHVGRYLAVRLESQLTAVNELQNVPVAAVLKQLRYVQQGDLSNLLPRILKRFAELPSSSLKLITWIHAAFFATKLCLFDENFTKSLFDKVRASKGEIRAKDASVLLHYLAMFDHSADGMDQFLVNIFQTDPNVIRSVIKFPETLTSALRSAVIRGLYPVELIDSCFSSEFISRFTKRHYFPFLDYYFLDCSMAIEKSNSGPRLDFKYLPNISKNKSSDMHTEIDNDSVYKKIHCHIANAVGKRLRCSTAAVQFCRILPHSFALDTVIRFRDGNFDMTKLQYEIKAYNKEELLVPADEIRIVLFVEHNNRCRLHTQVPLGHVQARKRQAIQLGYKVIELNGYEIARRPLNDVETTQLVNVIQQFRNSKVKSSSIVRAF